VIEQLKKEIDAIEEQAVVIDANDKEALYDLLVVSYYKLKDVVALLEAEEIPDVSEVVEEELSSLRAFVGSLQADYKDLETAKAIVERELEVFKEDTALLAQELKSRLDSAIRCVEDL
jgi:hypothetical protein